MTRSVRIGLLRLADAAPAIVAAERGMFERHGLDAILLVEPSWANIADKLAYGLLDAAVMLPPLAMAMTVGLRQPGAQLVVPIGISRGGNTIALSGRAFAAVAERAGGGGADAGARGRAVADWARDARGRGAPPRLGIVHLFSGHNLLLRHWLADGGADPDHDVSLMVLPPADMEAALADGRIDGFCAGAPWGTVAERKGSGRVIARGSEIRHRHGEKVLAVRQAWATADPERLQALLRALKDAALLCDDPDRGDELAALLAGPRFVDTDVAAIRPSLPGTRPVNGAEPADRISFADALVPDLADAAWFSHALCRWGWLASEDRETAKRVYRPDLAGDVLPDLRAGPDGETGS